MTLRRPARAEWLTFAGYLAISIYFTYPLLESGARLGISDWDALLFQHASVIKSIYEYGQMPFWNPWYCGGNVLWQNPQVALLTPIYLFVLVLPLAVAMKLNILVHYLVSFIGMHVLLTRVFKLSSAPAVFFLGATFTLAGGPALHLVVGHATFLPYFYLPWILFFFVSALETGALRFAVGTAAVIALCIYAGGTHITFMAAVGLGCFSVAAAVLGRDWRPLVLLGTVGLLAALFAAPKLVPLAEFVTDPRLVDIRYFVAGPDQVTTDMLQHVFTDPYQYPRMRLRGQHYGWHEYGNYLGPFGPLLIVASFVWILSDRPLDGRNRIGVSLAVTSFTLFVLMLGEFATYAPYALLRSLPLFSQFRLPSRYTVVFALFAVAMVAWVFGVVASELSEARRLRRFVSVILILGACYQAYWTRQHFGGAFPLSPLTASFRFLARPGPPTIDVEADGFAGDSPMIRAMMERNQAVLKCNEPLQLPGAVRADQPIVFAEGAAKISQLVFRPNRIGFALLSRDADRVLLNQRYVKGWRSSLGPLEIDSATQLAFVRVSPGAATRAEVWFVPPGLLSGLILLLSGLVVSAVIWRRTLPGAPEHRIPTRAAMRS